MTETAHSLGNMTLLRLPSESSTHRRLQRPWLQTGVSGFHSLEEPESAMEGGDLARLWKGGKKGRLSPLMQAKAWGLNEAGVSQVDIAAKLQKIGGGHPTQPAVCKLLERIARDPEWYPGKRPDASYGPAPVLRGAKRKQVAESAMILKRRGVEPTYANVVTQCPEAVANPETGKAVDKHLVYKVLKGDCRDDGAEEPWVCEATISRGALLPAKHEPSTRRRKRDAPQKEDVFRRGKKTCPHVGKKSAYNDG